MGYSLALRLACSPAGDYDTPEQTVGYIHTGGTPALFAYAPELLAHTDNHPRVITDLTGGIR